MHSILKEPVEIRLSRAKNPATDQDTLSILSRDTFWFVRDFVACNPHTPKADLMRLTKDPDFRIREDAKKTLQKTTLDEQIQLAALKKQSSFPQNSSVVSPSTKASCKNYDDHTIKER